MEEYANMNKVVKKEEERNATDRIFLQKLNFSIEKVEMMFTLNLELDRCSVLLKRKARHKKKMVKANKRDARTIRRIIRNSEKVKIRLINAHDVDTKSWISKVIELQTKGQEDFQGKRNNFEGLK
jgi:hypothetical protein